MVEPALPEPGHLACPVDQRCQGAEPRAVVRLATFEPVAHQPGLLQHPEMLAHSHSMVLSDGSALIFQRKLFQRTSKNRLPNPSDICALDFKREFRRLGICSISATIGINWSIF
jgi:hypothetical protein